MEASQVQEVDGDLWALTRLPGMPPHIPTAYFPPHIPFPKCTRLNELKLLFYFLLDPLVDSPNLSAGCDVETPYSWHVLVLLSLYPSTLHIHLIIRAGALPLWKFAPPSLDYLWVWRFLKNFLSRRPPLLPLRSNTLTSANFGGLSLGLHVMWCQSLVPRRWGWWYFSPVCRTWR